MSRKPSLAWGTSCGCAVKQRGGVTVKDMIDDEMGALERKERELAGLKGPGGPAGRKPG